MNYDEMLRAAYAVFATGDLDGYLSYCTPDIRFVIPGRNALSKTYDRETFKSELIAELTRDGKRHEYRTLHLYEFRDGKLASFREIPEDLYAFDAAWA